MPRSAIRLLGGAPAPPVVVWFLVSLGLHGAAGVWVKVRPTAVETRPASRPDVWSGRGIEIDPAEVEVAPRTESSPADPSSATSDEPAMSPSDPREHAVALEPLCVTNCAPAVKTPAEAASVARVKPKPVTTTNGTGTASSAEAAGAAPSSSVVAGTGTMSGDAFGAVGLPPGVRYLPKAYTRALNQGNWGVRGFATAPAGRLCDARFAISVGEDRRVGDIEYPTDSERDALPALCRTMLENGLRLVRGGEFSLDPKTLDAGTMRLRVEVELADGEPSANCDGDPLKLCSESWDPPAPGKRGRATFVLNSGRRVDAFVNIE